MEYENNEHIANNNNNNQYSNVQLKEDIQNFKDNIKKIKKDLYPIIGISQTPESAYQFICDNYQDYTNQFNNINENTDKNIIILKNNIINIINEGFNQCHLWMSSNVILNHFRTFLYWLKMAENTLNEINLDN